MKRISGLSLWVLAAVPFAYIATPLIRLFAQTQWTGVGALATDPQFLAAVATSLGSAVLTTGLSLLFGLPAAFALSLRSFPGKRLLEAALFLPLLLPPIVGGIAQLNLYGPNTGTGGWFLAHGIPLTNSLLGITLAQSFVTSPFLILSAKAGMEDIPAELDEAARVLGVSLWDRFLHVAVPLSRDAILTGAALTFARSIGEFGATMIMAYHPYTIPVDLWVQFNIGGLPAILPMAALLALIGLFIALVSSLPWRTARRRRAGL